MAVVSELIRAEADGTISFGDYTLNAKAKLDNFQHDGGSYKVKTFYEITKLERNDRFVYESVPGTAVTNFYMTDNSVEFVVEGAEDANITLELEAETEYEITINREATGSMRTNLGGKLSIGVELVDAPAKVAVVKK